MTNRSSRDYVDDIVRNNPIYKYCWKRCRRNNQNVNAVAVGAPGEGKSYACLRMAYDLDKDVNGRSRFDVEKQVFFDIPSFIEAVNSGKYPKGTVFIVEEAGVQMNARNWYSNLNKSISYVMQSFRKMNYVTLFNLPAFNHLDKQIQPLFHFYFQMKGINYSQNLSRAEIKFIDYNSISGFVYHKHLRVYDSKKKQRYILRNVDFHMPPQDIIDKYEAKKAEVLKAWYSKYEKELRLDLAGPAEEPPDIHDLYEKFKKDPQAMSEYWDFEKNSLDVYALQFHLNILKDHSYRLRRIVQTEIDKGRMSAPVPSKSGSVESVDSEMA